MISGFEFFHRGLEANKSGGLISGLGFFHNV